MWYRVIIKNRRFFTAHRVQNAAKTMMFVLANILQYLFIMKIVHTKKNKTLGLRYTQLAFNNVVIASLLRSLYRVVVCT